MAVLRFGSDQALPTAAIYSFRHLNHQSDDYYGNVSDEFTAYIFRIVMEFGTLSVSDILGTFSAGLVPPHS
jgi:hypothetical protein